MLFCTMTFIYVFLPIVCTVYLAVRPEIRNHVLLFASLIFYAWGEPSYLPIMLITIGVSYLGALAIDYSKRKTVRLICLAGTVAVLLGILGYFKYFSFICENLNELFHTGIEFVKVALPLGISFYTFQALSYLIDVYRGDVAAQRNFYKLALFISLFPQLIAGPIIKYHDLNYQIDERSAGFNDVIYGIRRFIIGLAKKMLIANTAGELADRIFSQQADAFSPGIAWLGAFAYAMQIFFDFSGYSDMAIGLGSVFGFRFRENFNYPYISRTISEFWRRWHISLSTWFKEYLYIPLGGNRGGNLRTCANLFAVFLVTGIWHGAAWTFAVWGIWNGFFIIAERLLGLNREQQRKWYKNLALHCYCILVFTVGWVLFRAPDLQYACTYIANMFALIPHTPGVYRFVYYIDVIPALTLAAAVICCMPFFKNIIGYAENSKRFIWVFNLWIYVLLILSTIEIATATYNPFIYFNF
jgi:alginate O-acetyltransferase complex protein AlgI